MINRTSEVGKQFIKNEEGLRLHKYNDAVGKGTIGYGHLIKAGESFSTISKAEAEELFKKDVLYFEQVINLGVKVSLKQHEFDALVSFAFNIGGPAFYASTLRRMLNYKKQHAADQFDRWVYGTINGKKVIIKGLVNRRNREQALFTEGKYK